MIAGAVPGSTLDFSRRAIRQAAAPSLRHLALALLLIPELVAFGLYIPLQPYERAGGQWWVPLVTGHRMLAATFAAATVATVLFGWDSLRHQVRITRKSSPAMDHHRWGVWLVIHLIAVGALIGLVWFADKYGLLLTPHAGLWVVFGAGLTGAGLVSWALSLMPADFWVQWIAQNPGPVAAGMTIGVIARLSEFLTMRLWSFSAHSTLLAVAGLLHLFGQEVIVRPERAIVGTPVFSVAIWGGCSGLEGIALIVVMGSAYLWLFRTEFRFPQALMLVPFGVALIWMLNTVRIASLVMLGQWWPAVAMNGFHSIAGWLFFNATAFALIIASRRSALFTSVEAAPAVSSKANPAAVYLAPLLAVIATSMVTRIFSSGFDSLYPVRVLAAGAVLWIYRGQLAEFRWTVSLEAIALGAAAFLLWVLLTRTRGGAADNAIFAIGLQHMSHTAGAGWLVFRILGAVVTVPIAEELAFRGYLLRKLISSDFSAVSYHFTWISFLVSSAMFAVLHDQWIAGLAAGVIFAASVYHRGRLCDAVVAHATANTLLVVWILTTRNWALWN